ncbi:10542_t:CDS:2, partial [Scutellospora calospora]
MINMKDLNKVECNNNDKDISDMKTKTKNSDECNEIEDKGENE